MAVGGDGVLEAQVESPIAFQNLYALYSSRLYKSIVSITKNPQDAEDALQDTFLRAYVAIDTFEGKSSIYSWLTRIAMQFRCLRFFADNVFVRRYCLILSLILSLSLRHFKSETTL